MVRIYWCACDRLGGGPKVERIDWRLLLVQFRLLCDGFPLAASMLFLHVSLTPKCVAAVVCRGRIFGAHNLILWHRRHQVRSPQPPPQPLVVAFYR
jgi:hypothetical protein